MMNAERGTKNKKRLSVFFIPRSTFRVRTSSFVIPVILALAMLALLPIFLHHFPKGHDAAWHYRWTAGFINALKEGSLYPRWHTEANFGQGSPVMLYYPPLPFYFVAAFSTIVAKPIVAIKLGCWLALSISGVTMYAFSRSFFSTGPSLLAASFYVLAPYHLFDLYSRSALSEFWAFAWVPLLLYAARRACLEDDLRTVSYVAISYALLLLTNAPIFFAVTLILPIYALSITRNLRRLTRFAAGLALGAGLGALYAVPVVFEREYVNIGSILGYGKDWFLFRNLRFVFKSPMAVAGDTPDIFITNSNWIALGLVLLFALSFLLIRVQAQRPILIVTAFSLLMTTRISVSIWKTIPGFPVIQFPTRWLFIVSVGVSLLIAAAASVVARPGPRRFIYAGLFALAIILNLTISALTIARTPLNKRWYKARQILNIETREYHPVWWDGQRHKELEASPVIVDSGDAIVSAIDDAGARQSYLISASTESSLRFRTLYFPGWIARMDGNVIGIEPSKEGNIQVFVEPGEHALALSFEDTGPRSAGKWMSAVSLLVWLAIFLQPFWRPLFS